jgi:fatty-acyl-CoA synthase
MFGYNGGAAVQGIGFWLTKRAFLSGDKEALVDGDRRLTYRELNQRVNRLARSLQTLGLTHGDRCAILAYNCAAFVEVIFATAKLGIILVPLNWRLSPAELAFNFSDSGSDTLIFDFDFAEVVEQLKALTAIKRMIVLGNPAIPNAEVYADMLARQPGDEPTAAQPSRSTGGSGNRPHHHVYRRYHRPTQRSRSEPGGQLLECHQPYIGHELHPG